MSASRRRKLPWHARPGAWIRGWLYHWFGREEEEEEELTDDHGNHISEDLPDYEYDDPRAGCLSCGALEGHHNGCTEYDDEPAVIRTARVGDVYLPLTGEPMNPWIPPAFTPESSRAGERSESMVTAPRSGPGHLTMWDIINVPAPWKPRTWPVILSRPRVSAGRITLLAGAW